MARVVLGCALLAVVAVAAAPAAARPRHRHRPRPWATVNVCDTRRHPDVLGLRASMPGSGRRGERMFMRFRVEYRRQGSRRWRLLPRGVADSGWRPVGSARFRRREAGFRFRFRAPAPGTRQVLRGRVSFQWRHGRRVRREITRHTRGGHRSHAGADPRGYSAARCTLRTPRGG